MNPKRWRQGLIQFKNGVVTDCWISRDGQLFMFPAALTPMFDSCYPARDDHGWYFNDSRDRYIAEIEPEGIAANPSFVRSHSLFEVYDEV